MVLRNREAVRLALRESLAGQGERLRPDIWKDLVSSHDIDLVTSGEIDLERLTEIYLQRQETHHWLPVARHEVVRVLEDDTARAGALSEMLARRLCHRCGVDAFREQALGGKLTTARRMPSWIAKQAAREGPVAARYVTIPVSIGESPDWLGSGDVSDYADWLATQARSVADDPASELPWVQTRSPLALEYEIPGASPGRLEIRGDGLLARLKKIVSGDKGLCALSGWSEQAAVSFVLCGQIPAYRMATVTVRHGAYPAAAQIELLVSANLSGKDVGELYQEIRGEVRGIYERAMDGKHLALGVFVDEHRESGLGWNELRRRWNQRYPKWRYKTANDPWAMRFSMESRRTWSRLTGEAWRGLVDKRTRLRPEVPD